MLNNNNMDIMALLDEMQEELELSPNAMFSKKKAVDIELLQEILRDIREALPSEVQYGKNVMRERDNIIDAAKVQAEEIIKEAKAKGAQLVDSNQIVRLANDKAASIMEHARTAAGELRRTTNTYAEEILDDLETYFLEYVDVIRENKKRVYSKVDASDNQQPTGGGTLRREDA